MRLFTCPVIVGDPRLSPEACAKRHVLGPATVRKWGSKAPVEWFASLDICRDCEIGKAHASGQSVPSVRYVELGTLRGAPCL